MNVVDTHVHVFVGGLKLAPVRRYAPDYDATIEDYIARMNTYGIPHAVIVQPSFLGTDNSFMYGVLRACVDTPIEASYFRHGGILPFVLRQLMQPMQAMRGADES